MSFQVIIELMLLLLISFTCFIRIQFILNKLFLILISFKFMIKNFLGLHSMKQWHLLMLLALSFIFFFNYVEIISLDLLSVSLFIKVRRPASFMFLRSIELGQMLIEIGLRQVRCVSRIQPVYFKIGKVAQFIIILWNFPSKLCLALIWLVFSFIFLFDLLKKWLSIVHFFNVQCQFSQATHSISW